MTVYHYKSPFGDTSQFHHKMTVEFGETNTDKTFYRPTLDGVRSGALGSGKVGVYDFPDGKDTGERYQPILRNKGIDITEVNAVLDNITNIINEKKTVDKQKLQEEIEKAKNDLKSKDGSVKQTVDSSVTGSE